MPHAVCSSLYLRDRKSAGPKMVSPNQAIFYTQFVQIEMTT